MAVKSSHTDTSYWLAAPRGVNECLNCAEDLCWYDREDVGGGDCPIWLSTPKAKFRMDTRINEALKAIDQICTSGPISTPDLAAILMDRGYYRNILYHLIDAGKLEVERIKAHKSSRHKVKIVVKGIKKAT